MAGTSYRDVVLQTIPKNSYPFLLMRHIFHDLLNLHQGKVLDLGCGRGDQMEALAELGFDVIGVDLESGPNVFAACDISCEKIPLPDNSVDAVFSKSLIEHLYIPGIHNYMSEIRRVLKPGGVAAIVTPDWIYCWDDFFDGFTHVTPFTRRSLLHCLQMHGFEKTDAHLIIQLPVVWHSRFMKFLSMLTRLLIPGVAPKKWGKWIRWSKEIQAMGVGYKPITDKVP